MRLRIKRSGGADMLDISDGVKGEAVRILKPHPRPFSRLEKGGKQVMDGWGNAFKD
jgi:hypothetical protein